MFVLLGLWVATLRPRRRGTVAFAAFSVFFGLAFTFQNLAAPGDD